MGRSRRLGSTAWDPIASSASVTRSRTTRGSRKPTGCKLVIKDMAHAIEAINSGVTDKYRMIICVRSIEDAKLLIDGCPQIKSLNLGNTLESPTTKQISRQIFLEPEEAEMLKELGERGVEVEIRALADDKKENALALL